MLKHLGLTDKVTAKEQANFIRFLTGKSWKEIYDAVREPNLLSSKDGRDATYLKTWFHKLGLTKIEEEIADSLNRPHEDLPPSNRKK